MTQHFNKWYKKQEVKIKRRLDARLARIEELGDLGTVRYLGDKLFELKWKIGIRVYFTFKGEKIVLLLQGGNKSGQKKDIQKARSIQKDYAKDS